MSCSLTLWNDYGGAITAAAGAVSSQPIAPGASGSLGPFDCATGVSVSSGATATAKLPALPAAGGSYTTLVYGSGTAMYASPVLADAAAPLPAQPGTIDTCTLRIFTSNAASVGVVSGVCGDNCLHPQFASLTAGGAFDYTTLPCDVSPSVSVSAGGSTPVTSVLRPAMTQYGQYTLVVPAKAAPFVVTDAAGPFPYTPIILTPLFIALAALLRRFVLGGPVARWYAARHPVPTPGRKPTAVGFVEFFGLTEAVAAARKARSGTAASASASAVPPAAVPLLSGLHAVEVDAAAGGSLNSAAALPPAAGALSVAAAPAPAAAAGGRIESIDALRGACLAIMILANYGGGGYWMFNHSAWNGLTVADLVFPIFVFTQGISMAISFAGERRRGSTPRGLLAKTFVRAAKLYALGLFVNNITLLEEARVLGVLQYFAVAYLVVGTLEAVACPPPAAGGPPPSRSGVMAALRHDVGRYWKQWGVMIGLELVYLLIQFTMPVPGCPTGYLGAGGYTDGGAYLGAGCTGGAHRAVDVALFGEAHIYHRRAPDGTAVSAATCATKLGCDVYDPEGALGWISAAWMTFLGLQAGRVFVHYRATPSTALSSQTKRWWTWGAVVGLLGASLAGFSRDGGVIPINKNLWSPSFVLVMAAIAYWGLALMYLLVDVAPGMAASGNKVAAALAWNGAPFTWPGKNSLLVYVGSETWDGRAPFAWCLSPDGFSCHGEAMASAVLGVVAWVALARVLHLKKMYFNI